MRKSASIRLGLLLAASALLSSCRDEPPERRCVDGDGKFADESLCSAAATPPPDGGPTDGATGTWGEAGAAPRGGGYHFIWIPYGSFGGVGTYAAGFQRGAGSGAGPAGSASGAATSGSVSRGGFGATGAAHASPGGSAGGHAVSGS